MMSSRHADLFRLWSGMRGRRSMPRLADVTPRALGAHLQDLFAIEPDAAGEFRFRYAGSALCAHFARGLTGELFTAPWRERDRADLARLCQAAFEEASPVIIGALGLRDGFPDEALSCLLLPVAGGKRCAAKDHRLHRRNASGCAVCFPCSGTTDCFDSHAGCRAAVRRHTCGRHRKARCFLAARPSCFAETAGCSRFWQFRNRFLSAAA